MANYVLSYDLNGPVPTHSQMDAHLKALGEEGGQYGRVLETVWYCSYSGTAKQLRDYLELILGLEDRVLVVEVSAASWRNLLVTNVSFFVALNAHQ